MTYRLALITGASSGIGATFAEALPAQTHLLLTGRNEDRLAALAKRLASPGREIHILSADLGTEPGRKAVVDWAAPGVLRTTRSKSNGRCWR